MKRKSIAIALTGALALPREPATLTMDLPIVADAFVVTVTGGLGSIPGAFVAAVVIGIVKALCIGLGTVDIAAPFLQARRATIYGGSSEIQRNVLSRRVLNLPN